MYLAFNKPALIWKELVMMFSFPGFSIIICKMENKPKQTPKPWEANCTFKPYSSNYQTTLSASGANSIHFNKISIFLLATS